MTPAELEAMILVCERHRVFACEVTSKGSIKVQFYPTPFEAPIAPAEEPPKRETPTPEEVQAALHLGGGRG